MIVLGIDPGVRKMWYALVSCDGSTNNIIDAWVVIDTDHAMIDRTRYYHRLCQMYDFAVALFDTYEIQAMAIEKLFFTQSNQNNAEFVYAVRGMICMLAHRRNILIIEPTPIQLKKAITGNTKASKQLMIEMIMRIYRLHHTPEYHDSADALWLALYAYQNSRIHNKS
jgi:crossover junction endodeoxyribonuclease RuvC